MNVIHVRMIIHNMIQLLLPAYMCTNETNPWLPWIRSYDPTAATYEKNDYHECDHIMIPLLPHQWGKNLTGMNIIMSPLLPSMKHTCNWQSWLWSYDSTAATSETKLTSIDDQTIPLLPPRNRTMTPMNVIWSDIHDSTAATSPPMKHNWVMNVIIWFHCCHQWNKTDCHECDHMIPLLPPMKQNWLSWMWLFDPTAAANETKQWLPWTFMIKFMTVMVLFHCWAGGSSGSGITHVQCMNMWSYIYDSTTATSPPMKQNQTVTYAILIIRSHCCHQWHKTDCHEYDYILPMTPLLQPMKQNWLPWFQLLPPIKKKQSAIYALLHNQSAHFTDIRIINFKLQ